MRFFSTLLVCVLFAFTFGSVAAQPADPSVTAIAWMRGQQQADGGFPGFGPGDTADAVIALVATGNDPASLQKGGKSPLDYLMSQAASYGATGAGPAAKLVLAATAVGRDPRSFGADLPALLGKSYDSATGQYGKDVTGHCLALLAISSLGATPPAAALQRLAQLQLPDGGWSFDGTPATGSDTNTTALCIEALVAAHQTSGATPKALQFLKSQQNADGGFPYAQSSQFGHESDANSTAVAIQALAALGEDTSAAVKALQSLQNPSGAFRFQASKPDDNGLATYQAVAGLLAKPLPLKILPIDGSQAAVEASANLPATSGGNDLVPIFIVVALLLGVCGALLRVRT